MPVVDVNGTKLDLVQAGAGRDLVLLHSLLADRSAFDRGSGQNPPAVARQPARDSAVTSPAWPRSL